MWNSSVLVIAIPVVASLAGSLFEHSAAHVRRRGEPANRRFELVSIPDAHRCDRAAVALVLTIGVTVSSLSYSHRRSVERYFNGGFLTSDLMVSAVATEVGGSKRGSRRT